MHTFVEKRQTLVRYRTGNSAVSHMVSSSIRTDLLLNLLDPALQAQDLLLQGGLLTLQGGDLLLETGIVRLLLGEVSLHFVLHPLDVRHHRLLQLLELGLVVLLDVLLVVPEGLDLLPLGRELLVLHTDEVLQGGQLPLQAGGHHGVEGVRGLVRCLRGHGGQQPAAAHRHGYKSKGVKRGGGTAALQGEKRMEASDAFREGDAKLGASLEKVFFTGGAEVVSLAFLQWLGFR